MAGRLARRYLSVRDGALHHQLPGITRSAAAGSNTAARPGGPGREAPHAVKMSHPCGDFDVSGKDGQACGQLAVPDGDQALGRPSCGAGGGQPGCLPAQARNRAGMTWRCGSGDASGGYRLAHHPDRVAQVVEQRFQIPAAPRSGARQELRGGHPRTGERINNRAFKQLRPQLSGTTVTTPVLRWRRPGRGGDVFPQHAERPRTRPGCRS